MKAAATLAFLALACLSAALAPAPPVAAMTADEVEDIYAEALRTAKAEEDLTLYWSALLNGGTLDGEGRRQVLYEMLENGAERAALPYLEQEASGSEEWLFAYAEAAERVGARAGLARFLTAELLRPELSPAERALRQTLLVEKAAADAVPLLAPLAAGDPLLAATYEQVLERLGRKPELAAFLGTRAVDVRVPSAERSSLVWRLLELGEKPAAEAALLILARTAKPEAAEVEQLLFLWGPRPPASALDWLEARARAAAGNKPVQAAWLAHLLQHGGAERVAGLTVAVAAGPLIGVRLRALAEVDDKAGLAQALGKAAAAERDPDRLLQIGAMAADYGYPAIAEQAVRAVLAQRPDQPEALLRLGLLAQEAGRHTEAARALGSYLAGRAGDVALYTSYADSLAALGRGDDAARAYRSALERLDPSDHSLQATLTRGRLLGAMGDQHGLLTATELAAGMTMADPEGRAAAEGKTVISYRWPGPKPASKVAEGGALILRFALPLDGTQAQAFEREVGPFVDEVAIGYDSLLVRPHAGGSIEAVETASGIGLTIGTPDRGPAQGELVLLRAQALLALGKALKARAVLLEFAEARATGNLEVQRLWQARQTERMDRSGEGLATFDRLIRQRGYEPSILALYAATLIDIGAFGQAADVLGWH